MFNLVLISFWLFLPAGIANMTPVFLAHLPLLSKLDQPLDFNQTFNHKPILGPHKTIRGLIGGTLASILTVYLQQQLSITFPALNLAENLISLNPFIWGGLLGFGALFGDAVKSFFKRRTNIKSGGTWIPFDQIDYILGGILFSSLYHPLSFNLYITIFLLYFFLHFVATHTGYLLKLKSSPI